MISLRGIFQTIFVLSLFASAGTAAKAVAAPSVATETATDIYHGTAGPVSGLPAPALAYPADYRRAGPIDGRSLLWLFSNFASLSCPPNNPGNNSLLTLISYPAIALSPWVDETSLKTSIYQIRAVAATTCYLQHLQT